MQPAKIPHHSLLFTTAFLFAFFFAVSCGTSDDESPPPDDSGGTPPEMESTMMTSSMMTDSMMGNSVVEETTGEVAVTEVVEVRMAGLAFDPAEITVEPGTTVRWVNEEVAEHNVISEDGGGPLRSETFREGGSYEYTFEEVGEFDYLCTVHPFMKGAVIVR